MESLNGGRIKTLGVFKNRYIGRRAFIIGNGPSLKELDLTSLKNEITFGVNSIFYHFETMGFKPTFYVVEDTLVAEDRADEINNLTGMVKIFGTYLDYCLADRDDVIWANVIFDYSNYPGFPNFSRNAAESLWVGGTVSYLCMQLAYYMGFSEVFLVGFDHSYTIPKDAKIEGNVITSAADDSNHFHPEYFGKGKRWHDPKLDRMELAYKRVREVFEQNGRIICNATAGGKLEVFPRIDYESLFVRQGNTGVVSCNGLAAAGQGVVDNGCSGNEVRISVVVCTHNNSGLLAKALESLSRQRLDKRLYEVIVVDNNSNDQTKHIVESYPSVRYVFEDKLGLSHARNTGIDKALGDIVAFIDDDAEAEADWVGALLRVYDTVPDAWAAGGRVLPIWDGERPEWLSDEFVPSLSIRDYGVDTRPLDWPNEGMIGTNCSFRREVFSTFGNFDINLGRVGPILFSFEEADLQRRIREAGHQIYHTNAIVLHHVPPSRMTREYFSKRALGNTVSKMFMDLRDTDRSSEIERFIDRVRKVGSNFSNESGVSAEEQVLDDLYASFVHECPDIAIEEKVGFVSVAADCYLEQGKYAKAEKKCLEGLSFPIISNELRCKLCLQLARVCLRQGKEERTKQILLDVLRTEEVRGKEAYQLEGIIEEYYEKRGHDSQIQDDFDEILGSEEISEHNKAAVLRCYSVFYINRRMYGQAEELYSRMFSSGNLKNSTADKLLLGLGELYKKWGRLEQAREVLTKALLLEEAMANEKTESQHGWCAARRPQVQSLGGGPDESDSSVRVRISVVVCTHRNPEQLAKTLESLSRQSLDKELYEVVVVDNNSGDQTRDVVERYPSSQYVSEKRLGLSYARNTGLDKAEGDIIAFIDDDAEASAGWLKALLEIYDSVPGAWAVGGPVVPIWDADKPQWLTENYYRSLSLVEWGQRARALCWPERIIGTNCSFRREVFREAGEFVPELGRIGNITLALEDTEMQQRIHEMGRLVYYTPDAVVHHHVPARRMSREYIEQVFLGNRLSEQIISLRKQGKTKGLDQVMSQIRGGSSTASVKASLAETKVSLARILSSAVVMQHPDDAGELMNLAETISKRSNSASLEVVLQICIESYPSCLGGYVGLGNLFISQDRLKDAVEIMKLAGHATDEAMPELYKLGILCCKQGNLSGAKDLFEQVLIRMPEELNLLVNLGKVCFDLGEHEESLRYFQSAVRIGPDEIEALAGLAGAAWQLNSQELFQQAYVKAYALKPTHPILLQLASEVCKIQDQAETSSACSPNGLKEYDFQFLKRKFQKWRELKDSFKGRRAFLIGNGPSLNETPLYLLKDEFTLCFNRFNLMFERLPWKPTMYMTVDERVAEDAAGEINEIAKAARFVFVPDIHPKGVDFRRFVEDRDNLYWLTLDWDGFSRELPYAGLGGTVANVGLQVLSYMGFSPIYLVGVDMDYVDHATAIKHDSRDWTSTGDDDPNHFDPRYFGRGKKYHYPRLHENMLPSMKLARQETERMGVKVVNVSVGGKLEVFRREDFGGLFNFTEEEKLTSFVQSIPGVQTFGDYSTLSEALPEAAITNSEAEFAACRSNACIVPARIAGNLIFNHIKTHIPFGPCDGKYVFVRRPEYSRESERIDLLYDQIRGNSRRLLMQYKDKYRGQRCVIIGNGPSLNDTDLSLLKNEYTFGLNKIHLLFDRIDWRPSFYVSVNPFVIQQSAQQILNEIPGLKFLDFVSFKYMPYNENTVHLLSLNGKGFSTDPSVGVFQMHTVTYVAMQLAYYLGFDEVFLVGVDHFFSAAGSGLPGQVVTQNDRDSDHFDPNYFAKGQQWNLPNLKGSEEGYRMAKAEFEKANRIIYDATVGGRLSVFERVDFYSVFGNTENCNLHACAGSG